MGKPDRKVAHRRSGLTLVHVAGFVNQQNPQYSCGSARLLLVIGHGLKILQEQPLLQAPMESDRRGVVVAWPWEAGDGIRDVNYQQSGMDSA
jgi:hypothetical protein